MAYIAAKDGSVQTVPDGTAGSYPTVTAAKLALYQAGAQGDPRDLPAGSVTQEGATPGPSLGDSEPLGPVSSLTLAPQIAAWGARAMAGFANFPDQVAAKAKAIDISKRAAGWYYRGVHAGRPAAEVQAEVDSAVDREIASFLATNKVAPVNAPNSNTSTSGGLGGSTVGADDAALALDQYRTGITAGQDVRRSIINPRDAGGMPINDPNARDTFDPVTGQRVTATLVDDPHRIQAATVAAPDKPTTATAVAPGAINPALLTPAQRLQAATQTATQAQGTTLDTGQADESRTAATAALQALQATSRGEGQAQVRSDAQIKLDLAKAAATAQGLARGARGSERKGALVQAGITAGEQGAQAIAANAAKNADIALAAQQTVGTQAQGNRAQDLAQASKRADLDAQQKTLQAQLDAARRAGDATRAQEIQTKMADLDQQVQALNASATNTANEGGANRIADASKTNAGFINTAGENDAARRLAAATTTAGLQTDVAKENVENQTKVDLANQAVNQSTQQFNSNQGVQVGVANNQGALAANVAGSQQDVAQAKLRLEAQDAIERSARGLLDEQERQRQLAIAREQLKLAQQRGDRDAEKDWFDKVSALVTTVGTVAAVAASDERLKTNIRKVDPDDLRELARAVRESASTYEHRTDLAPDLPEGPQLGAMAGALKKTRLGAAVVSQRPDGYDQVNYGQIAAILAAHNIGDKKRRAA